MRIRFWRRPPPSQPPLNVDFNWRSLVVPVPIVFASDNADVVTLIAQKMDAASLSMATYLNAQLWPPLPWYRRWFYRATKILCYLGQHDLVTERLAWSDEDDEPAMDYVVTRCRRYCWMRWESEPFVVEDHDA